MRRSEVREQLLRLIRDHESGEPLPSERTLSVELGASRPTVRAAIDDLARDGLVVRRHGRGTFARAPETDPKVSQPLRQTTPGMFAVPPAEGDWSSRVVDFEYENADARLAKRLERSPGHLLLHVDRIRTVEDLPMGIERLLIPADLVPGIEVADFESGNFYELLRMRYETVATSAVQAIEATVLDASEADMLRMPLHAPALYFERTTRDATGQVIEYTRSVYRGDQYRIVNNLKFDASSG